MKSKPPIGRPRGEPTSLITIPHNKLKDIQKLLGRKIGENQTPTIRIRIPTRLIKAVKKVIAQ